MFEVKEKTHKYSVLWIRLGLLSPLCLPIPPHRHEIRFGFVLALGLANVDAIAHRLRFLQSVL